MGSMESILSEIKLSAGTKIREGY